MIDLKEKLMKCPVCESVDLTMADRQGVEIDYCPKCRGVWLDRGELDFVQLAVAAALVVLRHVAVAAAFAYLQYAWTLACRPFVLES